MTSEGSPSEESKVLQVSDVVLKITHPESVPIKTRSSPNEIELRDQNSCYSL
jgi:hypothetical protein